jgi:flagellar biogenesis protein FliO
MVQENDVIAIIIIVLFFVLALIAFGIYRLVSIARGESSTSSGSSGTRSLADD